MEEDTHKTAQETLEFKISTPKRKFYFDQTLSIPEKWMRGVPNSQVYHSVHNVTDRRLALCKIIPEIKVKESGDI